MARLARLELSDDELTRFTGQLASVLDLRRRDRRARRRRTRADVAPAAVAQRASRRRATARRSTVTRCLAAGAGGRGRPVPGARGSFRRRAMSVSAIDAGRGGPVGGPIRPRRRRGVAWPRSRPATRRSTRSSRCSADARSTGPTRSTGPSHAGRDPGPLAGVPVALKDNLCTERHPDHLLVEDPGGVAAALRRDGRRAAAGGRRDRRRQDQHGRVRHGLLDRELVFGPDPQPPRPRPGARAGRAGGRRPPWRPGSCRSPSARTPAGRSASRPRCAAWSG